MGVDDLSRRDRQFLLALNGRLAEIEDQIKAEAIDTAGALEARVEVSSDWIQDYEIECTISFWLREDDPAYKEDDDNILIELREYLKGIDDDRLGIADRRNHNEYRHWKNHPMRDERHCWLYYSLYAHTDLGWANLLRIGVIWVDLDVTYQRSVDMSPALPDTAH